MIPFRLSEIAAIINAKLIGIDQVIQTITIDSRTIYEQCLFIALIGKKFDAHNFAIQAVASGAKALLVNYYLPLNVSQLITNDTHRALGKLGRWVRLQASIKVIAITGSSGKTSVKEMTAAILKQCGHVLATRDNFNNSIGVPLTLLRITPKDDFSIIELGANHHGEIAWTASLVNPDIVLVNNIFIAHLEGFGSLKGVAQAKGEIFNELSANGLAIINADSNDWPCWKHMLIHKKVWRFAIKNTKKADFFISNIRNNYYGVHFLLHSPQGNYPIYLPMLGEHNISNALAASALAMAAGATLFEISNGLAKSKAIIGRLSPIILGRGKLLLDDSYNSNVGSIIAAAKVLGEMPGYRIMIISDMAELGPKEKFYHYQVGKEISMLKINKILSIGRLSKFISNISKFGEHYEDKRSLIANLIQLLSKHKVFTVLIKGSHNTKMNHVVRELREKLSC